MVLMALVTSSGAPLQLISGHRLSALLPPSLEYSAAGEFPSSPRSLTITALMATPLIFSKWLAAICSAHSWRVPSNRDRNRNREEPQRNREHPHRNRPNAHPVPDPPRLSNHLKASWKSLPACLRAQLKLKSPMSWHHLAADHN